MTDLTTRTDTDDSVESDRTDGVDASGGDADAPVYAWAPAEPAPRKRRTGLWIGVGAAVAAVGLVVSSLFLVAPGAAVGGVGVGLHTPGAAVDAVNQRLAETTVVLTGAGGDVEVTGADLGASVDAAALVDAAYAASPAWNPTAWFPASVDAPVEIDPIAATSALRDAAPDLYTDPVEATLAFDAGSTTYVTTPSAEGTGIDVETVRLALQDAFAAGESSVSLEAVAAPVDAITTTAAADEVAARLNGILDTAGFYVGEERVVPVDRAVAASWLTVTPDGAGSFTIDADASAIEGMVGGLPEAVNRAAVDARVITNSRGDVLREEIAGVTGRELGETAGIAEDYAAQLAAGEGAFALPVTETEFATTSLARTIEVNLSSQMTYMFENGEVVSSYPISSGLPGTPTPTGRFEVFAHVSMQDMGCFEGAEYCTENVPWVVYFAPDIAFHGAYWHNSFGQQMSHGCVNLPVATAKYLYDWTPTGTEVWVHY
ncbi:L,D-transpeptidase [Microbacterium chocolatum]|uniref:L,D-transpeptidase family protein n=1 Tax=Microbacterium aurantiacum TaxID=162393 RepID=UPI00338EFA62